MTNVIAACLRCNYIRRDMPYSAWCLLIPGLKAARKAGLFAGWDNRVRIPNLERNAGMAPATVC